MLRPSLLVAVIATAFSAAAAPAITASSPQTRPVQSDNLSYAFSPAAASAGPIGLSMPGCSAAADGKPTLLGLGSPTAVRLISNETAASPYKGWSVSQLRAEHLRLEDLTPGTALPVTLVLVGATGLIVSFIALAVILGQFFGPDTGSLIAFAVSATTTAAMISIGGILLWRGADDRRIYGAQMDRVQRLADWQERDEQLLDMWERRHGPHAPPPIGPPPVGPPPLPAPPTVPEVSMVFPVVSARF